MNNIQRDIATSFLYCVLGMALLLLIAYRGPVLVLFNLVIIFSSAESEQGGCSAEEAAEQERQRDSGQ